MDEGTELQELLTWFLGTEDETALRTGLHKIPSRLWPAFSGEAADELKREDRAHQDLHRHLLGEERTRREVPPRHRQ